MDSSYTSETGDGEVDLDLLQGEQEVYGSDGTKIGNVEGITRDINTGEPYLVVHVHLGKSLYVPRHAIAYAVLGKPVRLRVSSGEAETTFDQKPESL